MKRICFAFKSGRLAIALLCLGVIFTDRTILAESMTVIAPGELASNDTAFASWTLQVPNLRIQQIYGARHFPNVDMLITELRFRPDSFYGRGFTTTVENIQFNLSTSVRPPDGLTTTFTNNVGIDDTIVFSGPLPISSHFTGPPGGPKDFDIAVPLTRPFLYNPAAGNLLMEIRNFSGSSVTYLAGEASVVYHNWLYIFASSCKMVADVKNC